MLRTRIPGITLGVIGIFFCVVCDAQDYFGPPTVQDCPGAIPVCQPVYTTTNSYTGHGNIYPEIHDNSVCPLCMDGEKNDVFYVITVQTNGILRFNLTPNNSSNDYDWSLFNMTSAECSEIYTNAIALQKSCNSYGVIGYNGPTGISSFLGNNLNCNGPGTTAGPPYNKDLTVQAGETYVLNISNWSSTQQSGYTLDFSGSSAVIYDNVPPNIDSIQNKVPCSGTSQLYVRFSENVKCVDVYQHPEKFTLTGPGGPYSLTTVNSPNCATGGNQSPSYTISVTPPMFAGSYTLNIVGDIRDLCDNIALYEGYPFHLTEINAPSASAGNDTTVANGAVITLHGNASGGAPAYSFHWEPAAWLVNPDVQNPTTVNMGASTEFTLTVTDGVGCHATDDVLVTVIGGPLGVNATVDPLAICAGGSAVLHAVGTGGSGNYTYSWTSSPPGFTSNLQDPTVVPLFTTVYTVQINDGFSTTSGSVTLTVHPQPVANAGTAFSIPYGTNATLNGYATNGSGTYSWYWTSLPPGYSSTLSSPTFVNLTATTVFELVVTDLTTGCVSDPSQVIVTVTGSPLAVNPVASKPIICQGETVRLFSNAGGGSGNYAYSWTSTPAGFTSTEKDPYVSPTEPTSFNLTVSDGFNQAGGSTVVQVNPKPSISLGPADTTLCVYDTLVLDAGNPNSSYYWSNGATSRSITVTTTGLSYDEQVYKVKVINAYGCVDSTKITAHFSFSACTGIIDRDRPEIRFRVYPNPGNGRFSVRFTQPVEAYSVSLSSVLGRLVYEETVINSRGDVVHDFDFTDLPAGIYIMKITTPRGQGVAKIIIQ